jgi:hypothetical protein
VNQQQLIWIKRRTDLCVCEHKIIAQTHNSVLSSSVCLQKETTTRPLVYGESSRGLLWLSPVIACRSQPGTSRFRIIIGTSFSERKCLLTTDAKHSALKASRLLLVSEEKKHEVLPVPCNARPFVLGHLIRSHTLSCSARTTEPVGCSKEK